MSSSTRIFGEDDAKRPIHPATGSKILIPNVRLLSYFPEPITLPSKIAYWSLLYDDIYIHVSSVKCINLIIKFLGSSEFCLLIEANRLHLLFDPDITTSYRPAFAPGGELYWPDDDELSYFGINYGGGFDEDGVQMTFDLFYNACARKFPNGVSRYILHSLKPAFHGNQNLDSNDRLLSLFGLDITQRLKNAFRGDDKKIVAFLHQEMLGLGGMARFYRNVGMAITEASDIDIDCLDLTWPVVVRERMSAYFDNPDPISTDLYDKQGTIDAIRRITGCPSLTDALSRGDRVASEFIHLSCASSAAEFRKWVSTVAKNGLSGDAAEEFVGRLIEIIRIGGKSDWIGWGAQNAVGFVPVIGNIVSGLWGAAVEYRRGKSSSWGPLLFATKMQKHAARSRSNRQ